MAAKLEQFFLYLWYSRTPLAWLLLPLAGLYRFLAYRRRLRQTQEQRTLPVPVIVIGNISVGGTGKTPIVIALAKALEARGYQVGIVSRGYGGKAPSYPLFVEASTPPTHSGDEPLLIARETGCPVMVGPDRLAVAEALLAQCPQCQVIISDDGLQHYRLPRTVEVVVIDGKRGLGNGFCLPAGPLREPASRLQDVDSVLINGANLDAVPGIGEADTKLVSSLSLKPIGWQRVNDGERFELTPVPWPSTQSIVAMAGIGHPQRFFTTLTSLDIVPKHQQVFADHHQFSGDDLAPWASNTVLMTTKDAVKCEAFAGPNCWALCMAVELPTAWVDTVIEKLQQHNEK